MRDYDQLVHFIKSLMDGSSATLVVAGQDLLENRLLSEGNFGDQARDNSTSRRLSRIPVGYFELETPEDEDDWHAVLAEIDKAVLLSRQDPGSLLKFSKDLHHLSTGGMGTLMALVTGAMKLAIDTGQERISSDVLDRVLLDVGATVGVWDEEAPSRPKPPQTTRRKRSRRSAKPITQGRGVAAS